MTEFYAFDLDKTLVKCNISYRFGRYLFSEGILSFSKSCLLIYYYFLQRKGKVTLQYLHERASELLFKGKNKAEICKLVDEFLDKELENQLIPATYDRLIKAKVSGAKVGLFSSSPEFLVSAVSRRLGCHFQFSTEYLIDSYENFSGAVKIFTGEDKANKLKELKKSMKIDQNAVHAFTDDVCDVPFLLEAGQGYVVNPSRSLTKLALLHDWHIFH